MTAALAACLVDWDPALITQQLDAVTRYFHDKKEDPVLDQPAALLVGGDISGIQDFIYTLSAQRAAKTLRGRSFYLQLLTEAVLRYVLNALGMPYTNVIYSGGGHFYLLAPVSALEKLPELRRDVTTRLLEHHGTSLYLALEAVSVPFTGFNVGQFTHHWDAMHRKLANAKQRRFSELGDDFYPKIFEPQAHGGNEEKTCGVCGVEREDVQEINDKDNPESSTGKYICKLCESFYEDLGRKLPNAPYVILGIGQPQNTRRGTALDSLAAFGLNVHIPAGSPHFSNQSNFGVTWALDDPQASQPWPRIEGLPLVRSLRYTVNRVPLDNHGEPLTFDKLQEKAAGIHRLGVLRMDVDGLGTIFKNGFGEGMQSIASLARVSTLSFQLSLFFEGWIKKICEDKSNDIYAVYAGGDDVFLIAPWDQVPGLALKIVDDFSKYTGGNPDLHISGGMAFIHGKYPIHQAAEDAGRALDNGAKRVDGKNAFHFLGENWKWPQFKDLRDKQKQLVDVSDSKNNQQAPRALLQVLQELADQEQKQRQQRPNDKRVWGPWMWIGDYQLTRMIERTAGETQEKLKEIRKQLKDNLYADILQWGKAARWAQLEIRSTKE
jgi:CRISPR-associated protein Csm1